MCILSNFFIGRIPSSLLYSSLCQMHDFCPSTLWTFLLDPFFDGDHVPFNVTHSLSDYIIMFFFLHKPFEMWNKDKNQICTVYHFIYSPIFILNYTKFTDLYLTLTFISGFVPEKLFGHALIYLSWVVLWNWNFTNLVTLKNEIWSIFCVPRITLFAWIIILIFSLLWNTMTLYNSI